VHRGDRAAIRVLCVDDDPATLNLYRLAFETEPDIECAGSVERVDGLELELERSRPDVLVIDLHMPGSDPLGAILDASRRDPELAILVVSGFQDPRRMEQALAHGARGFALKSLELDELFACIRRVARGERVVPAATTW
jgi:DNA-binding NarL/FixJ family response regulator